jgi:competence protein ComEA
MKRIQRPPLKIALLLAILFFAFGSASFALEQSENRININTASVAELQTLPGIGPKLAERVIAHRQKHGAFKRPQDIIIVRGFSANRYRQIAHLIRT